MSSAPELTVYTVGHSTRTIFEFIALAKVYGVSMVIDVRTVAHSRHNPQFNKEALAESLKIAGLKYLHLPELGGLRRPQGDSVNMALEKSFRGYADYMQTKEFTENLLKLLVLSKENCVALMCAEAAPWRCHRSLLSDALLVRHIKVKHILNTDNYTNHEINPSAHLDGTKVTYPLFTKEKPQRTLADFKTTI